MNNNKPEGGTEPTANLSGHIEPVVNLNYCYDCRREHGFVPKDNGAHTAARKKCESCGKVRAILGDRHWELNAQTEWCCSNSP